MHPYKISIRAACTAEGTTLLHLAAQYTDLELLTWMLAFAAEHAFPLGMSSDRAGSSPLDYAIQNQWWQVHLKTHSFQCNSRHCQDKHDSSPMMSKYLPVSTYLGAKQRAYSVQGMSKLVGAIHAGVVRMSFELQKSLFTSAAFKILLRHFARELEPLLQVISRTQDALNRFSIARIKQAPQLFQLLSAA